MNRRSFLGLLGMGGALAFPATLRGYSNLGPWASGAAVPRFPLPRPRSVSGQALTLTARAASVDFGLGRDEAWTIDGLMPSPTIRLRVGDEANITLRNELPEPTILHWHGLDVPEAADGHPRLAIGTGETYEYRFPVHGRAGMYWYHPHPHGRTAAQTYKGMAGLLMVEDDEEVALELPRDEFEIPLLIQDKRLGDPASLAYEPAQMGPDRMYGFLGDTAFANGRANAEVEVKRGVYRLRLLTASNARIFFLGLSNGDPMTLIGSDGGLLERPTTVERLMMGTGERADLLVDFSRFQPGDRVSLRSFAFQIEGAMGFMSGGGMMHRMGGLPHGAEMDVVEFVVTGDRAPTMRPLPQRLTELPAAPAHRTPDRVFRFESAMMRHTINGGTFEMERVDARIRRGETEIWSFVNDGVLPHPIHVHAGQMRVLSRSGGRGAVMPWEVGLKDTVLTHPGETVDVAVRFDRYPGLFLLHCHNLEHEDMGMMSNFLVEG